MDARAAFCLLLFLLFPVAPSWGAELSISPESYDFGEVEIGATVSRTFSVRNEERERARVTDIYLLGSDDFHIVSDGCSGRRLSRRESCRVEIGFAPQTTALRQGELVARGVDADEEDDDDPDADEEVAILRGTGIAGSPPEMPSISIADAEIDFGSVIVGQTVEREASVRNAGSAPLQIERVTSPSAPFRLTDDVCSNTTLPPGDTCTVAIVFEPNTAGMFDSDIDFRSNDPARPTVQMNLHGAAVEENGGGDPGEPGLPSAVPSISLPDSPIDFGSVVIGQTVERDMSVRNTGSAPLQIEGVTSPAAPFRLTVDGCSSTTLPPGDVCTVAIAFEPNGAGIFDSGIDFLSNDPARPTVPMSLHGAASGENGGGDPVDPGAPPLGSVTITDSVLPEDDLAVPFGDVPFGMAKRKLIQVTNVGATDVLAGPVPSGPISPEFTVIGLEENRYHCADPEGGARVLRPRQSCSVVVSFRPSSETTFVADLFVSSNDPAGSAAVHLSGAGGPPSTEFPAPQLIHPDPGQIDLRRDVTFRWANCRDGAGKIAAYRLYCSTGEDFAASRIRVVGRGALGLAGLGGALFFLHGRCRRRVRPALVWLTVLALSWLTVSCSDSVEDSATASLADLEPQTTHHWKVVAEYDDGLEMESEPQSFRTR